MKEKLIIKNFGPIKSVDLDLGKMTVLIGPSASGKSTILKVLAICRYFSYLVDDKSLLNNPALVEWGLDGFEKVNSEILYENSDYSVEFRTIDFFGEPSHYLVPSLTPKSDRFKNLMKEFEKLAQGGNLKLNIPHSFLRGEVRSVMDNPFYIQTERGLQSIFSLGKSSIQNLSDALFNQFSQFATVTDSFKDETRIEPLKIAYKNINGQGFFREDGNDDFYQMSKAASGFKSATPIVLATKYYSLKEKRQRTFLIEEPEQNLFPETQKALVEYLSSSINEFGHSMVLTTHSPYIISSINNLIVANRIAKSKKNKVQEIIDEKHWLSIDDVSAYCMKKDETGYVSSDLVLDDLKEISINYLDQVSSEISEVWEKLMLLEEEDV